MSRVYAAAMAGVAYVALSAGSAFAQVATAPGATSEEEEIVVTAARQGEQSLQDVPLSIQAFSGRQLEQRGIQDTADLFEAIPGASPGEQVGSVIRTFTLRGVGAAGGVGDSPIGYYVDNVPFAIPNFPLAPPVRMIDIERVEILRGPQGTLYGQGSAGGTIIYHTRDPDLEQFTARGESSISSTEDAGDLNYSVSGAVSIPIIQDRMALRISGGYDERAGYVDVYDGLPGASTLVAEDANQITNQDIRAVLLWRATDDLTLRAQISHYQPEQDYTQSLNSLEPPQLGFTGPTVGYENGDFDLYSVVADYDAGFATLTSSTSYLDAEFGYLQGQFFGFLGQGTLFNGYDAFSFAQELQLRSNSEGPLHWLLGAYYQQARGTFAFDVVTPLLVADGFVRTETENYSLFGEVSYDLFGGKIVPLIGLRYYVDDREMASEQTFGGVFSSGGAIAEPEEVTWRVNVAFHPTDNLTAYVTAGTGFRSGITQTALQVFVLGLDGITTQQALDPDSLTNYEAGVKAFLTPDLQVGASLYRMDFEDLQFGLVGSAGVAAFANVGEAETTGLDLEVQWRTPIDGLSVAAVANFNESKFGDVDPAVTAVLPSIASGERLVNTSEWNYRLDASFERPISNSLSLIANTSATQVSDRVMSDGYVVPDYGLYDASIGIRADNWEVSLFGDNLSDERGPSFVRNSLLFAGPTPRTIGLRLRADIN
jgi:iron complex outermembrane receptor protein